MCPIFGIFGLQAVDDRSSGWAKRWIWRSRGQQVVILLCAGDKSSQTADIEKAININPQFEG